jgi:hypothetical protein
MQKSAPEISVGESDRPSLRLAADCIFGKREASIYALLDGQGIAWMTYFVIDWLKHRLIIWALSCGGKFGEWVQIKVSSNYAIDNTVIVENLVIIAWNSPSAINTASCT